MAGEEGDNGNGIWGRTTGAMRTSTNTKEQQSKNEVLDVNWSCGVYSCSNSECHTLAIETRGSQYAYGLHKLSIILDVC